MPNPEIDNNHLFQWTQAIHRDLSNLRDNHLAHIADDLTTLKHDVARLKIDVVELKEIKIDVLAVIRRYSRRAILFILAGVAAGLGVPELVGLF